jgi:VCBS repeat-containing protein
VTDANGNTTTGTILVDIIDDVPHAYSNTNSVTEGADATGNVLTDGTDDVFGADGAAAGGGVVGVRAGSDTSTPASGSLGGAGIPGTYGTLTLNADGSYTYAANPDAVTGNQTDTFVYTIMDGDGDLSTTTLAISVNNVTVTASDTDALVNEAGLPNGSNAVGTSEIFNGAITPAGGSGPYTYALTGSADGAYGNLVLNATTGTYTYTLDTTYDGATTNNGVTTEQDKDSFGYTVTDANGNTTTGSITVDIVDDVPTATIADHAVLQNSTGLPVTFGLDFDNSLLNNYGADGGTVRFAASLNEISSGLTSGSVTITYVVSGGGLILTGMAGTTPVFVLTLDPATATYTVDMNAPVDSISTIDFNNGSYTFVGGNGAWAGFVPTGQNFGGTPVNDNSKDLLLTPFGTATTINGNANSAGAGGGAGGQNIGVLEGVRIDFIEDLTGNPAGALGYDEPENRDHTFDNHYVANGASFKFGDGDSNTTLQITARDETTGGTDANFVVGDGVLDSVTSVVISFDGMNKTVTFASIGTTATSFTVGNAGGLTDRTYTVQFVDVDLSGGVQYAVQVTGILDTNTSIATFTANGYSSLELLNTSGDDFAITGFGVAVQNNNPINFSVPIEVVDGDGDIAGSSLGVTLTPAGEGIQNHSGDLIGASYTSTVADPHIIGSDFNDTLTGNTANNVLSGGLGDDTLIGGAGADTLIGGAGNDTMTGGAAGVTELLVTDTFVWNLADAGTIATPAIDTINNFGTGAASAGGDVLNLQDILVGESHTGASLDNYLHFNYDSTAGVGGSTTLYISSTGAFAGGATTALTNPDVANDVQQIVFTGVNLTSGFETDAALIAQLITDQKLITD